VLAVKHKDYEISSRSDAADEIKHDVFQIIKKSYDKIGGHSKISSPDDIKSEYDDWIVADTDEDPDIDVFVGGNKRGSGMKLGASATDGSAEAKNHMLKLKKKLFSNGWWAETSGAAAHIAINKLGVPTVTDEKQSRSCLVISRSLGTGSTHMVNFQTPMVGTPETSAGTNTSRSLLVMFEILIVHTVLQFK